jgi:enolase
MKLKEISGRIIEDSRGEETIELKLVSERAEEKASVPIGKSTGKFEAVSLPARDALVRLAEIKQRLEGRDFGGLEEFDGFLAELDGTKNKSRLGANTCLALSVAASRILADERNIPLYQLIAEASGNKEPGFPRLFVNLINGGRHAPAESNPLAFQEYLVIPESNSPRLALKKIFELIEFLKGVTLDFQRELIKGSDPELVEGDEGGFVVSGDDPETGLRLLREAVALSPEGSGFQFGLDAAASSLFKNGRYVWRKKEWTAENLAAEYEKLIRDYDLLSIEDPFDEEAGEDWKIFNQANRDEIWVVGDDLTVTNPERIEQAGREGRASAVIIKPNQIGLVSEAIAAVKTARSFGWKIIVSHRSGETMDDFIADFSYGISADGLKAGSPVQAERLAKYQRLVEIEEG